MRKPWYLLYGKHIGPSRGGSGNDFFQERAAKGPPEAFGEGFMATFGDFCAFFGSLGAPFSTKQCGFFEVRFLVHFRVTFGRGRRKGGASPGS